MKAKVLILTVALLLSLASPVFASGDVIARDPNRPSYGGHFTMTTVVYQVQEDIPDKDIYGIKISAYSVEPLIDWFDGTGFFVTTTGICDTVAPAGGFSGGSMSVGEGGVSISLPYGASYQTGLGTNSMHITVGSALFPTGSCECYTEWIVNEGGAFGFAVMTMCAKLNFIIGWQDFAMWSPNDLVREPSPMIATSVFHTNTTVVFDASGSKEGYDGDSECPIVEFRWDFGDSTTAITTIPTITHDYPKPGLYKPKLAVCAPGLGWVSPKYVNSASAGLTIQIAGGPLILDTFLQIENFESFPPHNVETEFVTGLGVNMSYGGHMNEWPYNLIHHTAYVAINGTPLENAEVRLTAISPEGYVIYSQVQLTDPKGIIEMSPRSIGQLGSPGIYTFTAECNGKSDEVYVSYVDCLLFTGHTFNSYEIFIDTIHAVPEGSILEITTDPPVGFKLDKWILDLSWEFPGYNPIYVEMKYDHIVIAQFRSAYDVDNNGVIDLKDIYRVGKAYGSEPGDPKWDPACDFNHDNIIDLIDYFLVCQHYGEDA